MLYHFEFVSNLFYCSYLIRMKDFERTRRLDERAAKQEYH